MTDIETGASVMAENFQHCGILRGVIAVRADPRWIDQCAGRSRDRTIKSTSKSGRPAGALQSGGETGPGPRL